MGVSKAELVFDRSRLLLPESTETFKTPGSHQTEGHSKVPKASPCWRMTRKELKVLADQPPRPNVLPGRKEWRTSKTTCTTSNTIRVTAHTRGVSGCRKPQGSTCSPVRPPSILMFALEYAVVGSAAPYRTELSMNGPGAKSASWKTKNLRIFK